MGINRISAGRLDRIAKALSVPITVFFQSDAGEADLAISEPAREIALLYDHMDQHGRDVVDAVVTTLVKNIGVSGS